MPPRNTNVADFSAWKRRRDAGLRQPPLDCGRRDPDARPAFDPAPESHVLDPAPADAQHLATLRALWSRVPLTAEEKAAIARVGLILDHLTTKAGEVAA